MNCQVVTNNNGFSIQEQAAEINKDFFEAIQKLLTIQNEFVKFKNEMESQKELTAGDNAKIIKFAKDLTAIKDTFYGISLEMKELTLPKNLCGLPIRLTVIYSEKKPIIQKLTQECKTLVQKFKVELPFM